jgi:hypothetical protein
MILIENLHHSDETSGTTIVEINGAEHRAHWTEGHSDVVICEGLRGPIVGVLRADEASHDDWEALRPLVENPSENARPMTAEEEADWRAAMTSGA